MYYICITGPLNLHIGFKAVCLDGKESGHTTFVTLILRITPAEHTTYSRNNMGQKCEGNCGLWVLNEILNKTYPENLKKIVGAVWELPAK